MVTVSLVAVHPDVFKLHSNLQVPLIVPVTVEVGEEVLVMVGELGPLTKAQAPVSDPEAEFAASVKLEVPDERHWEFPATACLGPALLLVVMITEEAELPHELVMVQVNV